MPRKRKTKSYKKKDLTLENIKVPTYEDVIGQIRKKIGRRPKLPKGLSKGIWSKQALKVLSERYLVKDKNGKVIETPEQMCWRVAWEIASAEARWGKGRREVIKIAKDFYGLLVNHEFLPNSPTLMNAGTGNGLQYSACFVLPITDSLTGIFDAIKYQALIHQTGGGTGFSFSRLRPSGSMVKSSRGAASGPVSFMRIFDAATNEIKQGGKRRGANMGILRVDHPDILEFIGCKEDGGITNFNISVAITEKFMKAYKKGANYDLVDPKTKKNVGKLNARKVFDKIAASAWNTGDPGLFFIDRVNSSKANPTPSLGPVESTNPCGEQPLYPYDACNLGSIFLGYFVREKNGMREVDWERLRYVARIATKFLDNVIEVNPFPFPEIRRTAFGIRRIGLGVGGWADMLLGLGIAYDSNEALKLAKKIMKLIQEEALETTHELAKERGPFPLWPISIYKKDKPRRNSTVTTIAPTGSISIIAGASSGIEPLFALAYQHMVSDRHMDRTLTFINPRFEEVAEKGGFLTDEIRNKVVSSGVVRGMKEIPEDIRNIFGTAHEIHHQWHIKMQSVFQQHTENAVSKTINMINGVSKKDVKKAYILAWETGCRGITVFRDGCKDSQVLNLGIKEKRMEVSSEGGGALLKRPLVVRGATYKLKTPVGAAFITINENEKGEPLEVFINVGKAGSDVAAMAEALGRTISTTLRFKGGLNTKERTKEIAHQLSGIGGRRTVGFGSKRIRSLPDAIAVALSNHYGFQLNNNSNQVSIVGSDGEVKRPLGSDGAKRDLLGEGSVGATSNVARAVMEAKDSVPSGTEKTHHVSQNIDPTVARAAFEAASTDLCPSCGSSALIYEEGCSKCYACGYSEC